MQNIVKLSNRQTTLADKAGAAWKRHRCADREAFAAFLEAGAHLLEAKAGCKHGEFGAVVERSGIARSTATRAMKLSEAIGNDPDKIAHVSNFGIRGAMELVRLADKWKQSPYGERATAEIGGPLNLMMLLAVSGLDLVKLAGKIAKEADPDDSVNGTIFCLKAKLDHEIARGRGPWN